MNVKTENRVSSNMRRLRKGDRFKENGEIFECVGMAEKVRDAPDYVKVSLKRTHNGAKMRRYFYNADHRVKLIRA